MQVTTIQSYSISNYKRGFMQSYKTVGVCAREIQYSINADIIEDVRFIGGCDGNTKGLVALLRGEKVSTAIERLSGITCGMKATSCPDQLAQALKMYVQNNQ